MTEAIDARLEYFKELETATRALSQPGDKVVLQEDFLNMIQRLDACLDFLKTKVSQVVNFPALEASLNSLIL